MNTQKVTKRRIFDGFYAVKEIFASVQGEGPFSGQSAVFIRFQGCNLRCYHCDTLYNNGVLLDITAILDKVNSLLMGKTNLIVLTGGEPFLQDIRPLCDTLRRLGFKIQIESNGTTLSGLPYFNQCELRDCALVVSPKTPKVHELLLPLITAYKYVLNFPHIDYSDGLPTSVLANKESTVKVFRPHRKDIPVYILPCIPDKNDVSDFNHNLLLNRQMCYTASTKFGYIWQEQMHKIWVIQ